MLSSRLLTISCLLLFAAGLSSNARAQAGAPPTMMAGLRPQLVWQRTSPRTGEAEGPVLYQIIFRSSATPGNVPAIASNFTLTNSPIAVTGSGIQVNGNVQTTGYFTAGTIVATASIAATGGSSTMGTGVLANGTSAGAGVSGTGGSNNGPGVTGTGGGVSGNGVVGNGSGNGSGVVGTGGASGDGVVAISGSLHGAGISAAAGGAGGVAGSFFGNVQITGNVNVTGTITASGTKSFKIDHPLAPAEKYLVHAAIESSEVMNLYSGNVTLNRRGEAWVELPDWFEALNQDFRYVLTAIGAPGPNLYVAKRIRDHRFKIAGGKPLAQVSWQVTGVRHDAYMAAHPMQVEEDKGALRGTYLAPELFGQPEEKTMGRMQRPATR